MPLSLLYGWIIRVRNLLYDWRALRVYQANSFLISLGNLTTGGTGKTPMAEYLLRFARDNKIYAAYLSRGYGRKSKGFRMVNPNEDTAQSVGDEALQVAHKFPDHPVAVCERRAEGVERLQKLFNPQWIILDDAFQHRQVARDLDWVLIDASHLGDRDFILPAGNLREPLGSLKRADAIVVNKVSDPADIPALRARLDKWGKPLFFFTPAFHKLTPFDREATPLTPKELMQKNAILFSGIGNHTFFEQQVKKTGANVVRHFVFRDHYAYRSKDLQAMTDFYKTQSHSSPALLLTTEKDFYRIKGLGLIEKFSGIPAYYISIRLVCIGGEAVVEEQLMQKGVLMDRDEGFASPRPTS